MRTGWPALAPTCGTWSTSFNPPSCGQAGQPGGQRRQHRKFPVSIRRHADRLASHDRQILGRSPLGLCFNPPSCGQAGQPQIKVRGPAYRTVSIRRHADRLASRKSGGKGTIDSFQSAVMRTGWPARKEKNMEYSSLFQSAVTRTGWPAGYCVGKQSGEERFQSAVTRTGWPAVIPKSGEVARVFQSAVTRTGWPAFGDGRPGLNDRFNPPSRGQAGQP